MRLGGGERRREGEEEGGRGGEGERRLKACKKNNKERVRSMMNKNTQGRDNTTDKHTNAPRCSRRFPPPRGTSRNAMEGP